MDLFNTRPAILGDNTNYKVLEILQILSKRLCMTIIFHTLNFKKFIDLTITTQMF